MFGRSWPRRLMLLMPVLVTLLTAAGQVGRGGELPTGQDIASGYRQNAALFDSARVVWKCELHHLEPYRKTWLLSADEQDRIAVDPKSDLAARSSAKQAAADSRAAAKAFRPGLVQTMTVLQSRSGDALQFYVRDNANAMPKASLNAQTLRSAFADTTMVSRAARDEPWCV